ncbi:DMT family transporter [Thalassobaculum sp.]|uniref:DMT family transporter n=1 Tax=Thalassobaculum sp. TaxID=2022740 RepID=UPI0032ECB44D
MSTAASDTAAPSRGIILILIANLGFAGMDAVSKTLVVDYPVAQILWVRYAFFAAFATALSLRSGGPLAGLRSQRPALNVLRAVILLAEIACFVVAFRYLPLAETHSIAAVYPLIITALSAVVLGEFVGPRRWAAVAVGFVGVVVILRPGLGVFNPAALIPLAGAALFAVYQIMTKVVARRDSMVTILLYTGWIGFALTSLTGPFYWTPPDLKGWILLPIAGFMGVVGHLLLIKALELAPASVLQPFNYTLLVWATAVGFLVFGDLPDTVTVLGAGIVVASGLYTWWRERVRAKRR